MRALTISVIIVSVVLASGILGFGISNTAMNAAAAGTNKVTICHKPGPTEETITISENALPAHLAHGDFVGTCGNPPGSGSSIQCFCNDQQHTQIDVCTQDVINCDPTAVSQLCLEQCRLVVGTDVAATRCSPNVACP